MVVVLRVGGKKRLVISLVHICNILQKTKRKVVERIDRMERGKKNETRDMRQRDLDAISQRTTERSLMLFVVWGIDGRLMYRNK